MAPTRVESGGSFWYFDEMSLTYVRTPKHEGPRENPDHGRHGALQDLTPHPYLNWYVSSEGWGPRLYIVVPSSHHRVNAPLDHDEYHRWVECGYSKERRLDEAERAVTQTPPPAIVPVKGEGEDDGSE